MPEDTIDFCPKPRHRIEIGSDTTDGAFFQIAHPQSAFAGPSIARFSRAESETIHDRLGTALGRPDPRWRTKARENVDEWGLQDVDTLLLATQEELGELAQAHLEAEHEDGNPERRQAELDDLAALLFQLQWALEGDDV